MAGTSSRSHTAINSSNAAAFPVTTVDDGPFCAATEIDWAHGSMRA